MKTLDKAFIIPIETCKKLTALWKAAKDYHQAKLNWEACCCEPEYSHECYGAYDSARKEFVKALEELEKE